METVLISGGTGLIGQHLSSLLIASGYRVIILSRSPGKQSKENIQYAIWNVQEGIMDEQAFCSADYIVHLAGANVAEKRWTKKRKKEIIESRTQSSELIVDSLKTLPHKIKAVISASAIGWYGPDTKGSPQKGFTENTAADDSFLGRTCALWEDSIIPAENFTRLVILRTGIVFSNEGGAFAEFKKPISKGIAPIIGSGKQIISWIHIADLCKMYLFAVKNQELHGIYNAAAPTPVSNKELILSMAAKIRGKVFIPVYVPGFLLKLILGELSIEILKGTTVNPEKIRKQGFSFNYPTLEHAINDLVKNDGIIFH